jgi:hypothetical protein
MRPPVETEARCVPVEPLREALTGPAADDALKLDALSVTQRSLAADLVKLLEAVWSLQRHSFTLGDLRSIRLRLGL